MPGDTLLGIILILGSLLNSCKLKVSAQGLSSARVEVEVEVEVEL